MQIPERSLRDLVAFAKQAQADRHHGVLVTAGTSATGVALVGLARSFGLPTVAVVRDESGRQKLRELGADEVVVQSDTRFEEEVQADLLEALHHLRLSKRAQFVHLACYRDPLASSNR